VSSKTTTTAPLVCKPALCSRAGALPRDFTLVGRVYRIRHGRDKLLTSRGHSREAPNRSGW
jgi:hypothetical protein